jgi:hypothetical protein
MGNNLVVQERLVANEDYARLHKNSVNTIRVVSYILDGEIYTGPLAMRIGVGESFVDNSHAGGMSVALSDDGELYEEGYTENGKKFKQHPDSGVVFKGYKVPCTRDIINVAKRLHSKIPMLKFVSWDFMIDNDNRVVLIETNMISQSLWFPQYTHGMGIFGDNTDKMIRLARKRNKV